jgi:hypothetical protein
MEISVKKVPVQQHTFTVTIEGLTKDQLNVLYEVGNWSQKFAELLSETTRSHVKKEEAEKVLIKFYHVITNAGLP